MGAGTYNDLALQTKKEWMTDPDKSMIDFDKMFQRNYLRNQSGEGGIYMME